MLLDATAGAPQAAVAALAAPLLASRGALVLVVPPPRGRGRAAADPLPAARERLAALPAAAGGVVELRTRDPFSAGEPGTEPGAAVGLPPGVGVQGPAADAAARAVDWDALLARLGADPRLS